MILGYIVIALFMLAMSFYLHIRFNRLNKVVDSIVNVDIPSIEIGKRLVDGLLEQVRNEKKYLITSDKAFLDLFEKRKTEFFDNLQLLEEPAESNKEKKVCIRHIKELYDKYLAITTKEFIFIGYDESITPDSLYEMKKQKVLDRLTRTMQKLVQNQQSTLIQKIGLFQKTMHKSTKISLAIISFAIICGAIFSYLFTNSICAPIKTLKEATERIANGDLDHRVTVTSRDEIGSLGIAFNQMCDKLKEVDQMKLEFISNISHNLKTPLTSIQEANALMLDKIAGQLSESQTKLLTITKENTLRLIMMINDLLDISRFEAGLMRYNFQYLNIQDIIQKSIDAIRFLAESKNIHIQQCISETSVPKVLLDRDKISQVLDNILSNAVKFTPPGGSITVKAHEVDTASISHIFENKNQVHKVHSFIQVSISDTGIGIPAEYHNKIFDKFQQIVNKGKGGIRGTGLGLFIAKHIVSDHGGNIWVENNVGNGSIFHFILPSRYDYALSS
ncbi:MAG: HAMP domain-containing histidine kinase [wastewater metagenome]|nr:HAMP domain-containing histidine kinase [Candidatus Loosdrechtia aerotolerans]